MPRNVPIHIVDAFTDAPFAGNPAAVCLLDVPAEPAWMQSVASEMNLSETAFLVPNGDAYGLRWFTPAIEVELCGHATLASAHILWGTGNLPVDAEARFDTASGRLTCSRAGDWIEMDFPAKPATESPPPAGLFKALGIASAVFTGVTEWDQFVALSSAAEVANLAPDIEALRPFSERGVIVTAPAGDSDGVHDFVSRFFAPNGGIPEDPVTGSAHCTLAPYWFDRLGRDAMVGRQVSARGGTVRTRVAGNRVLLQGQAVTTLRGTLA